MILRMDSSPLSRLRHLGGLLRFVKWKTAWRSPIGNFSAAAQPKDDGKRRDEHGQHDGVTDFASNDHYE